MLFGHHYQNAYVCRDLVAAIVGIVGPDRAAGVPVYDVEQMLTTPDGPRSIRSRLAFIWQGALQLELIEPLADQSGVYAGWCPPDAPMRFHHACMRVRDWDSFRSAADRQPLPVCFERADDPHLRFLYLDARATLGHYLEYVWMTDARWTQMGGS